MVKCFANYFMSEYWTQILNSVTYAVGPYTLLHIFNKYAAACKKKWPQSV